MGVSCFATGINWFFPILSDLWAWTMLPPGLWNSIRNNQMMEEWVQDILIWLEPAKEVAMENIRKAQNKQKWQYNKHIQHCDYEIGEEVLMSIDQLFASHSVKLMAKWDGPFFVHNKCRCGLYQLWTQNGKVLATALPWWSPANI